ncbi:NADPH-dependent F420 reductase [Streptacidiphilus rugosus]|uniref:NADPH-dependent F420 reductase n=1 Tax=Streptacidiphilus rugosus TaxID=405783 RepID=UPI00056C7D34|nr:NAD(P)-binding domain-containing protein [Streptacidiphilus rugosus]
MRYAVLGTGIVGRTLAGKLSSLGHEVVIGTRDPDATLAREQADAAGNPSIAGWLAKHPAVRLVPYAEAGAFAEAYVNATSGAGSVPALEAVGAAHLAGRIVIDIANPLDFSQGFPPSLDPVNTDSLAETIQRAFPEARVVKALNTMSAHLMVNPSAVQGPHSVFVSGDDADAKKSVTELLEAIGWPAEEIYDLGDITSARGSEMLLPIWLRLYGSLGNADFNFHIQRGPAPQQ